MKSNLLLLLVLFVLSFASCKSQSSIPAENQNIANKKNSSSAPVEKTPVLVELFTSEG